MLKALLFTIVLTIIFTLAGGRSALAQTDSSKEAGQAMDLNKSKILVAYFSHSGNTKAVAGQIQSLVGGDLFEIVSQTPYPSEYGPTTEVAKKEQREDARPALTARVGQMDSYEVVFLGFPNWWGTMPMPLFTFLEQYDFSGKTIVPFCTHEGSRLGRGPDDLARLAPKASILRGFEIRGSRVESARPQLQSWLKELGFSR